MKNRLLPYVPGYQRACYPDVRMTRMLVLTGTHRGFVIPDSDVMIDLNSLGKSVMATTISRSARAFKARQDDLHYLTVEGIKVEVDIYSMPTEPYYNAEFSKVDLSKIFDLTIESEDSGSVTSSTSQSHVTSRINDQIKTNKSKTKSNGKSTSDVFLSETNMKQDLVTTTVAINSDSVGTDEADRAEVEPDLSRIITDDPKLVTGLKAMQLRKMMFQHVKAGKTDKFNAITTRKGLVKLTPHFDRTTVQTIGLLMFNEDDDMCYSLITNHIPGKQCYIGSTNGGKTFHCMITPEFETSTGK